MPKSTQHPAMASAAASWAKLHGAKFHQNAMRMKGGGMTPKAPKMPAQPKQPAMPAQPQQMSQQPAAIQGPISSPVSAILGLAQSKKK